MQWSEEAKRFVAAFCAIALILIVIGFCLEWSTGILMLCASALFGGAFWVYLHSRNQQIQRMTEEIDQTLHDADHIYIGDCDEGELSVLQSEIVKMTQRIRNQNDTLKREKENLADALAGIAHQLRTPLTSVNLVLSILKTAEDTAERIELLREADSLLRRMDALLTALLKLSRLDAGVIELKFEQISVKALFEAALLPLQIPMELLEVAVRTDIPSCASLTVDRVWLSEALQNILKNCMESAGKHGWIEISCEDTMLYTMISVHDSGKGFQKEELPHLFEQFYQGKSAKDTGFGIGLALAKRIIDRHAGLLTAGNHPAGGALFTMKFYK